MIAERIKIGGGVVIDPNQQQMENQQRQSLPPAVLNDVELSMNQDSKNDYQQEQQK